MPDTQSLGAIPHIVLGCYLLVLLAFGIQGLSPPSRRQ